MTCSVLQPTSSNSSIITYCSLATAAISQEVIVVVQAKDDDSTGMGQLQLEKYGVMYLEIELTGFANEMNCICETKQSQGSDIDIFLFM